MKTKEKVLRIGFATLFLLLGLWLAAALLERYVHGGLLFGIPLAFGLALALFPRFYALVFRKNRVVRSVVIALIIVGLLVTGTVSGLMLHAAAVPTAEDAGTIIILGCRVRGEQPSEMLQRRADAALAYLETHPDCAVIVTGGVSRHATISEAEAVRRYLIANGVDESQIYVEDRSINTEQNFRYAADIIQRNGLSNKVVIATDRFHQYRASIFAGRAGLDASPLPCSTQFFLLLGYWCREILAVLRVLLLGY